MGSPEELPTLLSGSAMSVHTPLSGAAWFLRRYTTPNIFRLSRLRSNNGNTSHTHPS